MDSCMRQPYQIGSRAWKMLQSAAPAVMGAIGAHGGASPHAHALRCGLGFGIAGRNCASRPARAGRSASRSVLLGMSLHGLYDFLLFAYQATFLTSGLIFDLDLCNLARARMHRPTSSARYKLRPRDTEKRLTLS